MACLINLINVMTMLSLCSGVVVKPKLSILSGSRPRTDEDMIPRYSYVYEVQDALTADFKNYYEIQEDGLVRGGYSFIEPDGDRRVINYESDPIHGFNAVVRKLP